MKNFKKLTMAVLSALLLTTVACGKSKSESPEAKVERLKQEALKLSEEIQVEANHLHEKYGVGELTWSEILKVPLTDLPEVIRLLSSLRAKGVKVVGLLNDAYKTLEAHGEYTSEKSEALSAISYASSNLDTANRKAEKMIQVAEERLAAAAEKKAKAANQ